MVNAIAGLERLAYGNVNDAVRLLLYPDSLTADEISKLDLFQISEIKHNKDGNLEIKFHDRLKACALLIEFGQKSQPDSNSFFGALDSAAKSACDPVEV